MEMWIQAISTIGFPIVCCIVLALYVKEQNKQSREDTKELNKIHSEEIKALKDEMKESLDNNTQAIRDLTEYIKQM